MGTIISKSCRSPDPGKGWGPGEAVVTVNQTQKAAWPTFRFPLELAVSAAGTTASQHVQVNARNEVFRFKTSGPVTGVQVDPDGWLLYAAAK